MSSLSNIPVELMYSLTTRQDRNWGVSGYKIPIKYFDYAKKKQERDILQQMAKPVNLISQKDHLSRPIKRPTTDGVCLDQLLIDKNGLDLGTMKGKARLRKKPLILS